jgi:urea carboxylase
MIQEFLNRHMESTQSTASYLPDNVEYLRKYNGLGSGREVFDKLLDTKLLIVSVVFLLACPNLLPLCPTSQMVVQKFNLSRIATPGGTLRLGGSLRSLYPVEEPGGYMMLARTIET